MIIKSNMIEKYPKDLSFSSIFWVFLAFSNRNKSAIIFSFHFMKISLDLRSKSK